MKTKTYAEITTEICDSFDDSIKPKKITRSSDNMLYQGFKATAKSHANINNVCVSLENKFDPENCPDEDLESVGKLVGTKKFSGKASAMRVRVQNTTSSALSLPAGTYQYFVTDDVTFEMALSVASAQIAPGASKLFTFYSTEVGSFYFPAQDKITVYYVEGTSHLPPSGLVFNAEDNIAYLGRESESSFAFRKRILQDNNRQDVIVELETAIKDLPYIFDASVTMNQSGADVVIDGITVHPFCIIIALLGEPRDEIAEIVARHGFYPSTMVDAGMVLNYHSACLAGGVFPVYYKLFDAYNYDVVIDYSYNASLNSPLVIEPAIRNALTGYMYPTARATMITENDFYTKASSLALSGVIVRNITLKVGGVEVPYIDVPRTKLGTLVNLTFTKDIRS